MDSKNRTTVLNIWNITDEGEKRTIMSQFLQKHGEYYTEDDFVSFLEKKYRVPKAARRRPADAKRRQH